MCCQEGGRLCAAAGRQTTRASTHLDAVGTPEFATLEKRDAAGALFGHLGV